jgi:hypothetical protein
MIGASDARTSKALRYSGLEEPENAGARKAARRRWRRMRWDILRPAAASRVHEGVPVAGTLSGSMALRSGTSFAAPADTRAKAHKPEDWDVRAKPGDDDDDDPFGGGPERVVVDPRTRDRPPHEPEEEVPDGQAGPLLATAAAVLAAAVGVFGISGAGEAMAPGVFVPLAVLAAIFAASLAGRRQGA